MVKSCRVKKRTIRGIKRKGFNRLKQKKDDIVNSNLNNAVNIVNTRENDKNCFVNNTLYTTVVMGRRCWWIRLFLKSIHLLFLKERLKLLTIQNQPLMKEV